MSDAVQTPGDVVAAAKAASRRARLLPVFTIAQRLSGAQAQTVAERLAYMIEHGDQIILDDTITLQFIDREPGQTVTFEIRTGDG